MQIKPDEITSILKSRIEGLEDGGADLSEVGTVLSVADGISRVHGLDNVMSMELLELPHDVTGLALNLESDNVGAVLFGPWDQIEEGDQVKRTGRLLEVPVGDALLGRIVDPLGRPLDGKGDIETDETRPAEFKAPGVVHRQPVKEPMMTGIKPIDAMTNVGRGQRELIIGDRQTGKTSICIDTIINNKDKDLKCVYVAIGQRMSTVVEVAQQLDDHGALDNTVIVAAPADEAAPIKFLAPVRGRGDRRALALQRAALARHLRRPHQARVRVPADVAAAPPPAGPRGVPGRRLLPALAPAGAVGEALRRARRGLVHRAADHRDAGRRRVGVHPDERHLDHRRPDLPRGGPVPLGRAAGDQRGHLGVARRRLGADRRRCGRWPAGCGSSSPSTASSRRSRSSARTSTPTRRPRSTAARGSWRRSTRTSAIRCAIEDQVASIYAGTGGYLDRIKVERVPEFLEFLLERLHAESGDLMAQIADGDGTTRSSRELGDCIAEAIDDFGPDFDEEGNPLEEGETSILKSRIEGLETRRRPLRGGTSCPWRTHLARPRARQRQSSELLSCRTRDASR